jgi:hypothetical protein
MSAIGFCFRGREGRAKKASWKLGSCERGVDTWQRPAARLTGRQGSRPQPNDGPGRGRVDAACARDSVPVTSSDRAAEGPRPAILPTILSSSLPLFEASGQSLTKRISQLCKTGWDSSRAGGEGGIRTPDTLASMPHFECGAFNHSATSPQVRGPLPARRTHSHCRAVRQERFGGRLLDSCVMFAYRRRKSGAGEASRRSPFAREPLARAAAIATD